MNNTPTQHDAPCDTASNQSPYAPNPRAAMLASAGTSAAAATASAATTASAMTAASAPKEAASAPSAASADAASAAASAAAEFAKTPVENVLQMATIRALALDAHGGVPPERDLDFIEVFAGEAAVSKALRAMGYFGATMDLRRDSLHNVLQPIGMLTLLALVMRLRPQGLLWLAPVCSTWVFMSRGSTGRRDLCAPRAIHDSRLSGARFRQRLSTL